jgi:hypothetical protein
MKSDPTFLFPLAKSYSCAILTRRSAAIAALKNKSINMLDE